jgi:hypothetical protein
MRSSETLSLPTANDQLEGGTQSEVAGRSRELTGEFAGERIIACGPLLHSEEEEIRDE